MGALKATATAPIKTFVFKSSDILKLLLPITALNIGSVQIKKYITSHHIVVVRSRPFWNRAPAWLKQFSAKVCVIFTRCEMKSLS